MKTPFHFELDAHASKRARQDHDYVLSDFTGDASHPLAIDEVISQVFDHFTYQETQQLSRICTRWHRNAIAINQQRYTDSFYDLRDWARCLSLYSPSDEEMHLSYSLLPSETEQVLKSPCRFYPGKMILIGDNYQLFPLLLTPLCVLCGPLICPKNEKRYP